MATPAASPGDESTGPITPAYEDPFDALVFSAKEDHGLDLSMGDTPFPDESEMLEFLNPPLYLDPSMAV